MPVEKKLNFILIGGGLRCGNSLLNRLLDGHSSVWSYPFEFKFPYKTFCHPWLPALPALSPIRFSPPELVRLMEIDHLIRLAQDGHVLKAGCEQTRIRMDLNDLRQRVMRSLEQRSSDMRDVYNALHASFFTQMDDQLKTAGWVCGSLPNACLSVTEDFFSIYPEGIFVQVIREPFGWTASMKSWAERNGRSRCFSARRALKLWHQLQLRARAGLALWPEQYRVVDHQALVENPEKTVKDLLVSLGLDMQEVCKRPTCMGTHWGGNTFGKVTSPAGVESAVLARWKSVLSSEEQRLCHQAMELEEAHRNGGQDASCECGFHLWSQTAAVYRDVYGWRFKRFWRLISARVKRPF